MKSQIGTLPLFLSHIREHSPRRGMGPDMRRDAVAGPSDARGGNLKRCLSVSGDMSQKRERLSLDEGPTIEAPGSPGGARDRAARISSNYSLCSGGSSRRSSTESDGRQSGRSLSPCSLFRYRQQHRQAAVRLSIDEEVDTHSTDDSRTFLESRGLADLATFTVTDPLGWELWAVAELNVILSLNWQRLHIFCLEPQWNLPAQEPRRALEEFHEIHGYGSPSRVIQAVIRRSFATCETVSVSACRFCCPPVLSMWASRCRLQGGKGELFVVTGTDQNGVLITVFVPVLPPLPH